MCVCVVVNVRHLHTVGEKTGRVTRCIRAAQLRTHPSLSLNLVGHNRGCSCFQAGGYFTWILSSEWVN